MKVVYFALFHFRPFSGKNCGKGHFILFDMRLFVEVNGEIPGVYTNYRLNELSLLATT